MKKWGKDNGFKFWTNLNTTDNWYDAITKELLNERKEPARMLQKNHANYRVIKNKFLLIFEN